MAAGLVTQSEFNEFARDFHRISISLGDNWHTETFQNCCPGDDEILLLRKKTTVVLKLEDKSQDADIIENLLEEDDSVITVKSSGTDTVCDAEYHVIYNSSYSVPVLYFNMYKPDGRLVLLEELWHSIPQQHQHRLQDRWTFVTQQEHPLLHRPFYQLHPCHTNDLMKNFTAMERNYLVTWLSSVGPVAHLNLPLSYAICRDSTDET